MAVFVKGDIHSDFSEITDFIIRFNLSEDDTIIILGDCGLYWRRDKKDAEQTIKIYEENYKTHILWLDGNHENFNLIEQLPDEQGTPFKRCSEHIHYIPRGTVFNIDVDGETKTCLACGGANSIDKFKRIKNFTWWEQESITDEDISNSIKNTKGKHIDYVFTHCCPLSVFKDNAPWLITLLGINQKLINHESENHLDVLMDCINFDKWFFGHYHVDKCLDNKFTCVFRDFIRLGEDDE